MISDKFSLWIGITALEIELLSYLLLTFMHWRRKWQPTPVFLPGESQGSGSLVGCCLWGHTRVGHDWSDLAVMLRVGLPRWRWWSRIHPPMWGVMGLIPGLRRSPGERNGTWWATVSRGCRVRLDWATEHTHTIQRVLLLKNSSLFYSYENFECKTNLNASIWKSKRFLDHCDWQLITR